MLKSVMSLGSIKFMENGLVSSLTGMNLTADMVYAPKVLISDTLK